LVNNSLLWLLAVGGASQATICGIYAGNIGPHFVAKWSAESCNLWHQMLASEATFRGRRNPQMELKKPQFVARNASSRGKIPMQQTDLE
jgi:hypothetical protein